MQPHKNHDLTWHFELSNFLPKISLRHLCSLLPNGPIQKKKKMLRREVVICYKRPPNDKGYNFLLLKLEHIAGLIRIFAISQEATVMPLIMRRGI
jgi:hypothetical protein